MKLRENDKSKKFGMVGSAVVMSLLLPLNASADTVEEIIVTARKTEEKLQETPLTISALTAKDLAERGIDDLYEVSLATPGFQFEKLGNRYGSQNGGVRPVIRGMSSLGGAEPNAALFVDGVLFSGNPLSFPMEIVERVEIIKGPQAALFGRSTFAGAINYITKRPTDRLQTDISARIAQYDDYELNVLSRGPLVADKLFFTLHGRYYDFGGEYRNRIDNRRVGQENTRGINASLEYRPTENFNVAISAGYNEDRDGLAATTLQDRFSNNCYQERYRQYYCGVVKTQKTTDVYIDALQGKEGLMRDSSRAMLMLDYDFGNFSLVSNSGFFSTYEEYGYDSDYISAGRSTTNLRLEVRDREEWSTELRLQSSGNQRFRWLAGVFYYERDLHAEQRRLSSQPDLDLGTTHVQNKAVFGSVGYDFNDRLRASLELRYAEDELVLDSADGNTYKSSNSNWTPRLTVDWKLTDDSMIYGIIAKGNKPGDVNEDPRLPPELLEVEEEESWNYEIGIKNTLFEGRMTMNLAAFFIDWSKQQLNESYVQPDSTTVAYNVNAGKTRVRGLEYTMNINFTDDVSGGFSYGLNDARFVEYYDTEAAALFGNGSLAGRQTPHSSKNEFTVFGRIQHQFTSNILGYVRTDFSYRERKYDQSYNLASTGDQKLLNLKLGLEWEKASLMLYVDNVTDDDTPSALIRYLDNKNLLPIGDSNRIATVQRGFLYSIPPGRRVGLNARYKF